MRKTMLVLTAAALLLVGCSQKTASPPQPTTPPPANNGGTEGNTTQPKGGVPDPVPAAEKTEEQIKAEIAEKLARLTDPKTGYVLPANDNYVVQDVTTLAEVTEKLRKKGYSLPLAQTLTQEFFKEQTRGDTTSVVIIPRGGHPGVFQPDQEATFTKQSKWTWMIVQEHKDNLLHGPHISSYEVEVLKDGTYRLNAWTNKFL